MRRLIAVIVAVALVGIALPAAANGTGEVIRVDGGPNLVRDTNIREEAPGGVRYDVVGTFIVTLTADGVEASTEIPADAVRYAVAADGSVTFELGEPQPEVDDGKTIADVSAEEWTDFVESGGDTTQYHTSGGAYPI